MLMYKLVKLHTNSMLKPLRKENIKGFSKKKGFCSQAATFLVKKNRSWNLRISCGNPHPLLSYIDAMHTH